MALKGDLASVDLAQVFQMLALNQKLGMLTIESPDSWRALYFDHRGVTPYFNEHLMLDRVLAAMVRSGELQEETVRESRDHAASTGRPITDSLLASGFVNEAAFDAGFRREMEEEIHDLFFWSDARFEFIEGASAFEDRDGTINERYFFAIDGMVMEAARRVDEWSYLRERVPCAEQVYRATDGVAQIMDLGDTELAVLEVVDGKRSVRRVVDTTGASAFHVYKSLARLLEHDLIEELPPGDLVAAGDECVAEGRLEDGINLFERAVELEQGLPGTHAMAAEAYEAAEEFELAAHHLAALAEHHVDTGDAAQAVALYRHVIGMLPTDLAARERLVELTAGSAEFGTEDFDPALEGRLLVDLYLETGDIPRVRGILERLLHASPGDVELKKRLIHVHTSAGDTRRVIELYESIADDHAARSEPIAAVKYLQKLLMLDRSRDDISARIKSLYEIDERNRSRRRAMSALLALLVLLAAGAVGWFLYDRHAQDRYATLDVAALVESEQFAAAEEVYAEFASSYPFSLVAADARMQQVRMEARRRAHEAKLRAAEAGRAVQAAKDRDDYRALWERHRVEFEAEELLATVECLEAARRMVLRLGQDEDRAWAREVQLDKSIRDLRVHLRDASELAASARELLSGGRWREARRELLALVDRFELTEDAKQAEVPVMVTSTPSGASITRGELPLTDAAGQPVTTPAVVFFHRADGGRITLHRQGFTPREVVVDASAAETSHHVLTVVPRGVVEFPGAAHSPVAARGSHVVAGLSGGRVGIANMDDGSLRAVIELGDLREMSGAPAVARDRLVFGLNEPRLLCHSLTSGELHYGIDLQSPVTHGPVVRDGRIFVVDRRQVLSCFGLQAGELLWEVQLPGEASGPPSLAHRRVRLGTSAGEYLALDTLDGAVVAHHDGFPPITTEVLLSGEAVIFGTVDGQVIALDERTGVRRWSVKVGAGLAEGALAASGEHVLAVADDLTLTRIDRASGRVAGALELPGSRLSGPVTSGGRVYLSVREAFDERESRDLLLALDAERLEVLWEYRDGGRFRGPVTTDGLAVFLPGSSAKVLRFR